MTLGHPRRFFPSFPYYVSARSFSFSGSGFVFSGGGGGSSSLEPQRFFFSFSGQSNMAGSGGEPAISTESLDRSFRITTPTTLGPLFEGTYDPGETPVTSFARSFYSSSGINSIVHNWSQGGTAIASFLTGQSLYNQGLAAASSAVSHSANNLASASIVPYGLIWDQGESDALEGRSTSQYRLDLDNLQRDFERDIRIGMGQPAASVPLYYIQILSTPYNGFTSSIAIAHDELNRVSGTTCRVIGPSYHLIHTGIATNGDPHYTSSAHRRNGEMFAKVVNTYLSGGTFTPLRFSNAFVTGNIINISVEGGDGSDLVLDTSSVPQKPFYGFSYFEPLATASSPHIFSASVGARSITLTLTNTGSTNGQVRYGYYALPGSGMGRRAWFAPGGNIRDQEATPSIYSGSQGPGNDEMCNEPFQNWMMVQDRVVNGYTAAGSTYTASTSLGAVKSNGHGTLTAYENTTLDGATSFVMAFKFKKEVEYPNGAYLFGKLRSPTFRQFAVRHAGDNNLQMYLSADTGSANEWIKTPNNVINTGITYASIIIFSGSGAGNVGRLSWWISSDTTGTFSQVSCSYGGTIPSSCTSGALADFSLFGISLPELVANRLSGTIGEIAIWRNKSASVAQINDIFPSGALGRMADFTTSTSTLGLPDNWYRFAGDFRDSGRRGNHLYPYFTGSITSAVSFTSSLTGNQLVYSPLDGGSNWSFYGNRVYTQVLTSSVQMTGSGTGLPLGGISGSMSISFWLNASGSLGSGTNSWGTSAGNGEAVIRLANLGAAVGSRFNSFSFNIRPSVPTQAFWTFATGADDLNVNRINILSASLPNVEIWNHWLLVWSSTGSAAGTGSAQVFVNGTYVPVSIGGYIPSTLLTSACQMTYFGSRQGSGSTNGSFAMTNIGWYNTALSTGSAIAHYNSGSPVDLRTVTGSGNLIHYHNPGASYVNSWDTFPIVRDLITGTAGITPMHMFMNNNMGLSNFTASSPQTGIIQIRN